MKWSNKQKEKLKELCFAEKSNKEISEIMGISLNDVYAGRSRFGITIAKVEELKSSGPVKRTKKMIQEEIKKVEGARVSAYKKTTRCDERLNVLFSELEELEEGQ